MNANERIALIAGATGLIGGFCLQDLLGEYSKVISLVRKPTGLTHPKLTELIVNFDELSSQPLQRCDDVFCTLGTTIRKAGSQDAFRKVDFGYPAALAGWTQRAGAKQFLVVSSVGADPNTSNFYLKTKGQMEESIQRVNFQSLHIFRPSLLMGPREETRLGEQISTPIMKALGVLMIGPLSKYRAIKAGTVAQAMVHAAQQNTPGKHLYHYNEILEISGKS